MDSVSLKLREIKPALAGYIRESQELIRRLPMPDDRAVHDVRVLMKRARAVMRLISSQTDSDSFRRDYESFRETGRMLSLWRETSVHRKTLKDLKKKHPKLFATLQGNERLDLLLKKQVMPEAAPPEILKDIEKIEALLNKAGFRLRFQKMDALDPKMLLKALEETYNVVADKYLVCRNEIKAGNLHLFRKKAKDFLYQLWFFRPLNPDVIKSLEKKLDIMTQNLGRYNDLAQLVEALGYRYSGRSEYPGMDELIVLIREAQDRYLSDVWPTAYKIFSPNKGFEWILGFKILVM